MCGDAEAPKYWDERPVKKARKNHKCEACSSEIDIGEAYMSVFAVYDEPTTFSFCSLCWSKYGEYHELMMDGQCGIDEMWDVIEQYE